MSQATSPHFVTTIPDGACTTPPASWLLRTWTTTGLFSVLTAGGWTYSGAGGAVGSAAGGVEVLGGGEGDSGGADVNADNTSAVHVLGPKVIVYLPRAGP